MVDHSSIRRAREIAEEIGLGGQEGGQIHAAVYSNDGLIDSLGSLAVDDLKTGLRRLDHYILKLSKESEEEIADPDFLVSRDALLDDIKDWFDTRTRAEPATERLMERVKHFILSSEDAVVIPEADPAVVHNPYLQLFAGGVISSETQDVDGNFQERIVLTGPWQPAEKPSGLS